MQSVHTGGLLSGSCRPQAERWAVRADWRHRAALREERAAHLQPRQTALQQMHVPVPPVLTASTGAPGRAMLRASAAGERAPVHRARGRAPRCASRPEELAPALTGHDQPEHGLARQQARALDDVSPELGRECEADSARRVQALQPGRPHARPPRPRAHQPRPHHKQAPDDDARG
jgi:transposase